MLAEPAAPSAAGASIPAVSAARRVPASPGEVFDFLSDLGNHWELADRFIEVTRLEREPGGPATGGSVLMRGPLGIRRSATTRVTGQERPNLMTGTAELPGGTRARVTWTLTPDGDATMVCLAAEVEQAKLIDRLLLAFGGRAWFRRRFAAILDTLAERLRR